MQKNTLVVQSDFKLKKKKSTDKFSKTGQSQILWKSINSSQITLCKYVDRQIRTDMLKLTGAILKPVILPVLASALT
jgi:hypothetical protein